MILIKFNNNKSMSEKYYNRAASDAMEEKQAKEKADFISGAHEEANKFNEEYDKLKGVFDYFSFEELHDLAFALERTMADPEYKGWKDKMEVIHNKVVKAYRLLEGLNKKEE